MGTDSKIEWTTHTWNPWQGCTPVSEGCDHCYARREMKRYGKAPGRVARSKTTFDAPLKKDRAGKYKWKPGERVFVCSWSDFFHDGAYQWMDEAWEIMRRRPDLIFTILTKRIGAARTYLPKHWGEGWPHVELGISAENDSALRARWPLLMVLPAARRVISYEPALGSLTAEIFTACGIKADWVFAGGESGPDARPAHPDWFRAVRDACAAAGVPFLFKQWGEWIPRSHITGVCPTPDGWGTIEAAGEFFEHTTPWNGHDDDGHGGAIMYRVGKKRAGRLLDGALHDELPATAGATENTESTEDGRGEG